MAIAESLRYLGNMDIPTDYMGDAKTELSTEKIIWLYEIFERMIEEHLTDIRAVYVKLEDAADVIFKITLEGVTVALEKEVADKLSRAGISTVVEEEDGNSYVRFRMAREV